MKILKLNGFSQRLIASGVLGGCLLVLGLDNAQAGWKLECGGRAPAWSVEVFPKSLKARVKGKSTMLPILSKRQAHGRYNRVAIKTHIRSASRADRLDLTLTFTKSCRSVSGKLMSFRAKGDFNQTSLNGCCRAVRS